MDQPLPLCRERILEPGALAALPDAIARHELGGRLMLVCDDETYVAAGQQVHVSLIENCLIKAHSIGRRVHATLPIAESLIENAHGMTGLLAIGTGTVNDITKYAAHRLRLPYISVPTGASMNGFTSATASLDAEGIKQSFTAAPPRAVVADLDIIAAAPRIMARAGLGDTLCRTTVEADCLLSHVVLGTPYPREEFALMRRHEAALFSEISKIKERDRGYIRLLMEALLDAGDAMARTGSSITASQGEHMIAHTLEMMYGGEIRALHGEIIAVTAHTMSELHNQMLLSQPVLRPMVREENVFQRHFGKRMAPLLMEKYKAKLLNRDQCEVLNATFERDWPAIKLALADIVVKTSILERAAIHANLPQAPRDLGLHKERYNAAVSYAYLTRNRFTFLDLAHMMNRRVVPD